MHERNLSHEFGGAVLFGMAGQGGDLGSGPSGASCHMQVSKTFNTEKKGGGTEDHGAAKSHSGRFARTTDQNTA